MSPYSLHIVSLLSVFLYSAKYCTYLPSYNTTLQHKPELYGPKTSKNHIIDLISVRNCLKVRITCRLINPAWCPGIMIKWFKYIGLIDWLFCFDSANEQIYNNVREKIKLSYLCNYRVKKEYIIKPLWFVRLFFNFPILYIRFGHNISYTSTNKTHVRRKWL